MNSDPPAATGGYIPVIDIAPFRTGEPAAMAATAREVADACANVGFLQIVGHGVDPALVMRCYDTSRAFFDRPTDYKLSAKPPSVDQVRGYSAVGAEGLSYSLDEQSPGDLKESFSIGPSDVPVTDYYTNPEAGPHFAPNVWPAHEDAMRSAYLQYFQVMAELSAVLMQIFAVALDLPVGFFDSLIDKHISMFRVLNYPEQANEPAPGQLRAGAHSDYGSLTILRQENAPGGLQVRDLSGNWQDVPAIDGAFVVNIGDLMQQWTNDRWQSTVHRVINPPRTLSSQSRRISLVFFHQPNYDAVVECLASCHSPDSPARYGPVTSGRHLYSKFVKQSTLGAGMSN